MSNEAGDNGGISDEERLILASKLDDDLEKFIDGLEKKGYTEGWPEDRWEEEMDKHPFFMKKAPEIGDPLHPMLEGLQQLKYDPMENTTEDLAITYKEDGNFYLKHKKYRMAIYSYTEGIKLKCQNAEINSMLYNNRSAAQYFLKNYRSSLVDASKALAINPKYQKALWRSAVCHSSLEKYDECIDYCDRVLQIDPKNVAALDLRKASQLIKSAKDRDDRKRIAAERKLQSSVRKTLAAIEARGIRFEDKRITGCSSAVTIDLIKPCLAPLEDHQVHLSDTDSLVWPAAFCYPEFLFSDFQQNLDENTILADLLADMFSEPMECDKQHRYKPNTLNVYFENHISGKVHKVDVNKSVGEIISDKNFLVTGGCLTFFVVPMDSNVETEYLTKERHPMTKQC